MPPSTYRPLPVDFSQAPPGAYDQTALTYDEMARQKAAMLAQKLAVEQQQLSVDKQQGVADREAKLRDELAKRLSQPNTDGSAKEATPDEALQIAQKLALEAGDIDAAINIEKATRDRMASADRPLTPEQIQFYQPEFKEPIPPNATLRDIQNKSTLYGRGLYERAIGNTQDRFNNKMDRLLPDGFEGNPTEVDSKIFKTVLSGVYETKNVLDQLEQSLSRTGMEAATGDDYVLQRQLVGDLALILKSPAFGNLGAALSPSEYELLLTQLPRLMASPQTSLGRVFVERGLGRDPIAAINAIRAKIQRKVEAEQNARNIWPIGRRPQRGQQSASENPDALAQKLGGSPEQAPALAEAGPKPDALTDPDGYKAWYMANKLKSTTSAIGG